MRQYQTHQNSKPINSRSVSHLVLRSVRYVMCLGVSSLPLACSLETQSKTELRPPSLTEQIVPQIPLSSSSTQSGGSQNTGTYNERQQDEALGLAPTLGELGPPVKVEVERLSVARGVKQRRVIGPSDHFPNDIGSIWSLAQVYAFDGTAELEMRWWRGEILVSVSPFLVSEGLRWREWSKLNVKPSESGSWRVEVFQPSLKKVLMSQAFTIGELTKGSSDHSSKTTAQEEDAVSIKVGPSEPKSISATPSLLDQPSTQSILEIKRLTIARQIKRRRPIDTSKRFSLSDERLWGYIEVSNYTEPSSVWMEWYHEEVLRSRLKVRVGVSRRWRTWSWQRLSSRDKGQWSVKVLSSDEQVLAETHFIVVE